MSKTSEIDPYWIASMYHNGKTMAEFVQALHDVGLTKDESTILWRIIDAAIDIQPDRDTKAHRAEPERAPNNRVMKPCAGCSSGPLDTCGKLCIHNVTFNDLFTPRKAS